MSWYGRHHDEYLNMQTMTTQEMAAAIRLLQRKVDALEAGRTVDLPCGVYGHRTILLRHDTMEEWVKHNPTLGCGEAGYAYDVNVFKVGDGATPWTELQPVNVKAPNNTGVNIDDSSDHHSQGA